VGKRHRNYARPHSRPKQSALTLEPRLMKIDVTNSIEYELRQAGSPPTDVVKDVMNAEKRKKKTQPHADVP